MRAIRSCAMAGVAVASLTMMTLSPIMTPELAEAIMSWKARNQAGASDSTYGRLDPPRLNKGAPFESVDELRLVYGTTLDLLLGEDANRNGVLDDAEKQVMRDQRIEARFAKLDANGDGAVTLAEMKAARRR